MTPDQLADAFAALGVANTSPMTQGGQKLVFKGTLAGVDVVVKIVPIPSGPGGQIVLERAHREVELLAAVDSPYVVSVLSEAIEIGEPVDAVAWVEGYLEGDDLGSHLQTAWADEEVFGLLSDMAQALGACHQLSVVHRDLSPGNVRRLPSSKFVLMDPGYAKHLRLAALTGLFQPGTSGFRSPEHVAGGNTTAASDIFSLGILAYYARSLQFPIDPTGPDHEYDRRLLHTQSDSLAVVAPDADPDLVRIVDQCLRRQPARRFLDGGELLDALTKAGRAR